MTRPRLLYLAFFYPPSRASGVYRAIATSQLFAKSGWDVTVVTADRNFLDDELGAADRSLEQLIPDGVVVERVPFTFSRHGDFPFESAGPLAGHLPGLYFKMTERRRRSSGSVAIASFPDRYWQWVEPVMQRVGQMTADFDHILATGNPYASFEAARLLADDHGVRFSVDYRDPWSFDPATSAPIHHPAVDEAESRIIAAAAKCFHVNTAIASAYARRYPESAHKHVVALNGFDEASLGAIHSPRAVGPLRFGMLGTLTERWPLDALFTGWRAALPSLPAGSELILAGYLGFFDRSVSVIDSLLPRSLEGFSYVGPVAKERVGDFNDDLDVVVAPVPDGEMITGSKIFEALAIGLPVVCVQASGGGARAMLDGHPYAFGADPHPEAIAAALIDAAAAARSMAPEEPARIRSSMRGLERLNSLRPLLDAVNESIEDQPRAQ
ncbi:MAG TPA: glycosyltransferase [Acidimicrobiia bacterium]